jgi:bacterioferritin-associated ferredoxin
VRGADAAERAGRLAALAALRDAGIEREGTEGLRAELARYTRFAAGLRAAFPWPARFAAVLPDETIVCRCEAITAGELRRVVREMGAKEANRAKAFSRVGMGRCQGRFCAHAGAEVIAAEARVPLEAVGRLRGQAPVKPLPMVLVSTCAVSRDAEEADTCAQEFNE